MNLEYVRGCFPALTGDWAFFDNAGGSQILGSVMDRVQEYLRGSNVQHGASYAVSRLAAERLAAASRAMAEFTNAAGPAEVVFGPSASMLLRILSLCLAETFRAGDEIIVTNCDHEANIGPWVDLARRGIEIKTWRVHPETWELRLEALDSLLSERTRLVACTQVSNVLGRIHPIAEIARRVHGAGALLCVDGVAFAPHRRIDLQALDADFYVLSCYKVYGPHQAILYGKTEQLLRLPGLNHFFIGAEDIPYKFQPGGPNYELSYGLMGLWDYLDGFARAHGRMDLDGNRAEQLRFFFDLVAQHEKKLTAHFLGFLESKKGLRVIGPVAPDAGLRVPTLSFVADGRRSGAIVAAVDEHQIGIRFGDFYARRLIEDLGLSEQQGVVRVSMVHYNSLDELDRLIEVLDRAL